ncbi:polysaccharide deacetylase family protein [Rhizobium paknamense]|uniref:Chitooligosaccharide deacetylase n=1 Tax=Rhizobium paknamense TaxID=1206817 RepID=A0ABU0IJA6_9HYPH|nr:polysaccharide deacetylase family protein [Rhizobium paknamense]MDQ0458338.1 peptidoglycan/xylan/chitin deacetylase (PgdA/CDA1 family) [Rhizobium paknamense]
MTTAAAEGAPRYPLLFVNFHHVCDPEWMDFPRLHHVSLKEFEAGIEALGKVFDFPPIAAVETALLSDKTLGAPSCVLTFDDGLADHAQYVVPVLERYGIEAIFSVCTSPWIDGHLLSVHRAHLLSAAFSYVELADELEAAAALSRVSARIADVSLASAQDQYRYDDAETARIKFFINAVIPQDQRGVVLSRVFTKRLGDDRHFAIRHYMSSQQVKEISNRGHTIGLHSHRHLFLASAAREAYIDDLYLNRAMLTEVAGPISWISYPYGGRASYDDSVIAVAEAVGCRFGLTTENALNSTSSDRMRLSRSDQKDVLGGKAIGQFLGLTR